MNNINFDRFNLSIGKNASCKTYYLSKQVKEDPEVEVVEINPGDDNIIEKLDKVITRMNEQLTYYKKENKKPNSKTMWLIIDDYDSCSLSCGNKSKFNFRLILLVIKARLTNINILIGTNKLSNVPVQLRHNMKYIDLDEIA